MTRIFYLCLFVFVGLAISSRATAPAETANNSGATTNRITARGDSVQVVLRELSRTYPELVSYIPETGRWHLNTPKPEGIPAFMLPRLQDAFYYDAGLFCQFYGRKYLADWQAILAKAARETFWGASYLCNRAFNYFGIRREGKPWVCESFQFCRTIVRNDPEPADFVVFPDFETSLWMFIHTIYSFHFLERLPDYGDRVVNAMYFERKHGVPYWESAPGAEMLGWQLQGDVYSYEELIYTWSEHPFNNLCVNCSRETDLNWISQISDAASRSRE